ncbi:hypothetical protein NKR23_g8374 [Pleurostoma richardsiae]|uniref:Uncharacterized protein n=1 Tax=Pleurostoma richardsiae TaxID=41990 RepID=A0AA38VCV2_9PEZI|nr:hypothetical protein NKR23_g8374 [Pleurostoma richardsiae]
MSTQALPSQVSFLTDAAHLLRTTAPETSAYLMSRRSALLVDNDIPISDMQRQHVCSACGHIMLPGQGSTLKIETDRAIRKSRVKSRRATAATAPTKAKDGQDHSKRTGISKVYACGNCTAYTKISLPPPNPISRRKRTAASDAPASPHPSGTGAQKPSANASSKKRAKNRKAGLQALLSQNQASSGASGASGLGLSLADFMKK